MREPALSSPWKQYAFSEVHQPTPTAELRSSYPPFSVVSQDDATNPLLVEKRAEILSLAPLLEELALRCGQPGAMHWLKYFLDEGVTKFRSPVLVLALQADLEPGQKLRAEDLRAAALFFEYRFFGIRTGIVSTGDAVGFNSIVAPLGERSRVAVQAARALLGRGALLVLSTFESADEPEVSGLLREWREILWGWRERKLGRMLPLGRTLDETLATLGKSTRFNLRYYRRRLAKEVGCEYIADAASLLRETDLRALNQDSLNPVPFEEFERRVRSASELSGSYLSGLRTLDGRWLSLIGGWRQDGTTVLFWQLNALGYEKYSVGTAMRAFYLEDEIERGAGKLLIFGGTSHTMRHGFIDEPIADLVVQRRGLRARLVRAVAAYTGSPRNPFRRVNYLADVLHSPEVYWSDGSVHGSSAGEAKSSSHPH